MLIVSVVFPTPGQHWHLRIHVLSGYADCRAEVNAVIIRENHRHRDNWTWIHWAQLFDVLGLCIQGKCRFTTCNLF